MVGTLVERTTRFVVLAKMGQCRDPYGGREFLGRAQPSAGGNAQSMTYDQGHKMHGHKIVTKRTGV